MHRTMRMLEFITLSLLYVPSAILWSSSFDNSTRCLLLDDPPTCKVFDVARILVVDQDPQCMAARHSRLVFEAATALVSAIFLLHDFACGITVGHKKADLAPRSRSALQSTDVVQKKGSKNLLRDALTNSFDTQIAQQYLVSRLLGWDVHCISEQLRVESGDSCAKLVQACLAGYHSLEHIVTLLAATRRARQADERTRYSPKTILVCSPIEFLQCALIDVLMQQLLQSPIILLFCLAFCQPLKIVQALATGFLFHIAQNVEDIQQVVTIEPVRGLELCQCCSYCLLLVRDHRLRSASHHLKEVIEQPSERLRCFVAQQAKSKQYYLHVLTHSTEQPHTPLSTTRRPASQEIVRHIKANNISASLVLLSHSRAGS